MKAIHRKISLAVAGSAAAATSVGITMKLALMIMMAVMALGIACAQPSPHLRAFSNADLIGGTWRCSVSDDKLPSLQFEPSHVTLLEEHTSQRYTYEAVTSTRGVITFFDRRGTSTWDVLWTGHDSFNNGWPEAQRSHCKRS